MAEAAFKSVRQKNFLLGSENISKPPVTVYYIPYVAEDCDIYVSYETNLYNPTCFSLLVTCEKVYSAPHHPV